MFRRSFLTIVSALTLLLLAIAPVYAAPSLSLGSRAAYGLTGRLAVTENCSAVPAIYAGEACSGTPVPPPSNVTLNGAGSTFVAPLLASIDASFTSVNPSIQVNYQPVGSGTGLNDLTARIVDFGASDAPLTNAQIAAAPNVLTIPDTIGAVAIAYNIPINNTLSLRSGLLLNATIAAEIFQGNITYWDDSRIVALNQNTLPAGVVLPHSPVTIVHRSDSSGTTFVFSGYLSSSPVWKLGQSKTIPWPVGSIGVNGNTGEAAVVQGTKDAVGYVELDYALSANPPISYAYLFNSAGQSFIQPTLSSTSLAVTSLQTLPTGVNATAWQSVSLLNSTNPGAYPIVSFSYIMVYRELNVYGSAMTAQRARALVDYLSFLVGAGQMQAAALYYAPLSANVEVLDQATIQSITYNGQSPSIPSPPVPPPSPMTIDVELSGTVGWSVEGLNTDQANLNVSHTISVSISPSPGVIIITPVTEIGSFEQSINLSTRVESPSTSTAILESLSSSLLASLAGTSIAAGGSGSSLQNILLARTNSPDYTMWWVNGPIALGNSLQILQGWSSVTGSESLNLAGNIGTRSAWIVTSQTSDSVTLNIPNPSNPLSSSQSNANANLKLLWSYDKNANLLLRNDNAANVTMHSETPTSILTSAGPVTVTVTRDMSVNLDVALLLLSTNLSLAKTPARASTLLDTLSAMPWMPIGIAGVVVGLAAGALVWFTRRNKGSVIPSSAPPPTPASSPPSAS